MIILDYHDRRPLYEQITEKFRILILRGAISPGEKMPSVRQLAVELSMNPNTIQRAYMELEQEGLIYPVKGRGNFVADTEQIRRKSLEDYRQELKEVIRKGMELGIKEEELLYIVRNCCKEEGRYRENRKTSSDSILPDAALHTDGAHHNDMERHTDGAYRNDMVHHTDAALHDDQEGKE